MLLLALVRGAGSRPARRTRGPPGRGRTRDHIDPLGLQRHVSLVARTTEAHPHAPVGRATESRGGEERPRPQASPLRARHHVGEKTELSTNNTCSTRWKLPRNTSSDTVVAATGRHRDSRRLHPTATPATRARRARSPRRGHRSAGGSARSPWPAPRPSARPGTREGEVQHNTHRLVAEGRPSTERWDRRDHRRRGRTATATTRDPDPSPGAFAVARLGRPGRERWWRCGAMERTAAAAAPGGGGAGGTACERPVGGGVREPAEDPLAPPDVGRDAPATGSATAAAASAITASHRALVAGHAETTCERRRSTRWTALRLATRRTGRCQGSGPHHSSPRRERAGEARGTPHRTRCRPPGRRPRRRLLPRSDRRRASRRPRTRRPGRRARRVRGAAHGRSPLRPVPGHRSAV